jgi:stage V sporulation protein G
VEISEVRINLNKGGKIKAFAQVVLDGALLVGDIRVLEGKEGTVYVTMPARRLRNGSLRDIVHPLSTEARKRLEEAILGEYHRSVAERGAPGDESNAARTQLIAGRLLDEKFWTDEEREEE